MPKDILTLKKGNAQQIPPGSSKKIPNTPHPSYDRQSERLAPKFQRLSETMDAKRTVLQSDPNGIDPEMVLIFEVVGSVMDFIRAASKIGMEFMGDCNDYTEPDADFYNINQKKVRVDTPVLEKLYLTSTDQRALNELLSLWRRYTAGETEFPSGLAPFKNVFAQLKDIRKWGIQERFIDTYVIDEWRRLLQSRPEKITFEIELWFRSSLDKRQKAEEAVRNILARYGGR
ncbi:MAG: hypothetical protein K2H46_12405, partial [Muribaculaceae bacterium]|nr:hypothetical protein [Muribaculaceae bacterium]